MIFPFSGKEAILYRATRGKGLGMYIGESSADSLIPTKGVKHLEKT